MTPIVQLDSLGFRYGQRSALSEVSLQVHPGERFGLLGPNGSGKSTLFRILSTLVPPQDGTARLFGLDLAGHTRDIRRRLGVVFQMPSLDAQLTGMENLIHHGHLFGLRGASLRQKAEHLLNRFGLADRAAERAAALSGGLRRRLEIAKAMISDPQLLLMDEPSTGLDPAARLEFAAILDELKQQGVTVLLTTHLLEEADRCDRLALMDQGRVLACDTPTALKQQVGREVITLRTARPDQAMQTLEALGLSPRRVRGEIRTEVKEGAAGLVPRLVDALPGEVNFIAVERPTLEDVFLKMAGRELSGPPDPEKNSA